MSVTSSVIRASNIRNQVKIIPLLQALEIQLHHRSGGTQQIRCPFHDDKRPSARVYTDTDKLYCFTCGKSWDVINIVMGIRNLKYSDALEWIESNFKLASPNDNLNQTLKSIIQTPSTKKSNLNDLASMVETKLISVRHKLGLKSYVNLLLAIDLIPIRLKANQMTVEQAQDFYQTILQRCDLLV